MNAQPLIPHPEGGSYREVFRSTASVTNSDSESRSALTHIYFSLKATECSLFHRVTSDEVWNLYQGDGVRLHLWDSDSHDYQIVELSASAKTFCYIVPAGYWQATEPLKGDVLCGCSVAPGFEFSDFSLLRDLPELANQLSTQQPTLSHLISR